MNSYAIDSLASHEYANGKHFEFQCATLSIFHEHKKVHFIGTPKNILADISFTRKSFTKFCLKCYLLIE